MSPEVIAIVSVGVTLGLGLGSLQVALWREIVKLTERVTRVETRMAWIEGVIEGVLSSRPQASP